MGSAWLRAENSELKNGASDGNASPERAPQFENSLQDQIATLEEQLRAANRKLEVQESCWRALRVDSDLTDVELTVWEPTFERHTDSSRYWRSFCPCCKKPITLTAFGERHVQYYQHLSTEGVASEEEPKYAYVAALWGKGSGFSLGALVLGQSLLRAGGKHDLVLLHTSDVPSECLQLLGQLWQLQPVEYVNANDGLFAGGSAGSRFSGVFTKLHALSLVEYQKVLLLDIDLAILDRIDPLFELPAPAALWRGQSQDPCHHGIKVDGRLFFGGSDVDWGQTGGINAGVMLLAPNWSDYQRALREVCAPTHPERIPGAGPEQDYLSRFYAPHWTHISVQFIAVSQPEETHRTDRFPWAGLQILVFGFQFLVPGSQFPVFGQSFRPLLKSLFFVSMLCDLRSAIRFPGFGFPFLLQ